VRWEWQRRIPDRSIRGRASGEGTKEAGEVAKGSLRSEINQPNGEIFKKLAKLSFRA